MKRLPFLDWMRGLALILMIQCHVFNSFARMDVRNGGLYAFSQFTGGMAGPLFLFMVGITFAFQLDSLEHRQSDAFRRWWGALQRAGYIFGIAFLIRLTDWISMWPHGGWAEITRVDILNSMGLALAAFSPFAILPGDRRIRSLLLAAILIAAVSPIVANWNWAAAPPLLHEYLAPGFGRGHFPFFPCGAYIGFGITAGAAIRMTEFPRMDRTVLWSAIIGGALILAGQYVSNLPYSVYPKSNFWTDNPALIAMRVGISLVVLAGCFAWTTYCASPGWSWVQSLGKNSLLVYWVHLVLIYGALTTPFQHALSIPQTAIATVAVTAMMVGLAAFWQWWKQRPRTKGDATSQRPAAAAAHAPQ